MHLRKRFLFYSFLLLAFVMATIAGYLMGQQDLLTKGSPTFYFDKSGRLKVPVDVMAKGREGNRHMIDTSQFVSGIIISADRASDGSTVIMVEDTGPNMKAENDLMMREEKEETEEGEASDEAVTMDRPTSIQPVVADSVSVYKVSVTGETNIIRLPVMAKRTYPSKSQAPTMVPPERLTAADLEAGMMVHIRKNDQDVALSIDILPMDVTDVGSNKPGSSNSGTGRTESTESVSGSADETTDSNQTESSQ